MIDSFLNWRRKKRLLFDHKLFYNRAVRFNKDHYIRQLDKLKQAIMNNDQDQIKARSKVFSEIGMIAPTTLMGCEKILKDLNKWRV